MSPAGTLSYVPGGKLGIEQEFCTYVVVFDVVHMFEVHLTFMPFQTTSQPIAHVFNCSSGEISG